MGGLFNEDALITALVTSIFLAVFFSVQFLIFRKKLIKSTANAGFLEAALAESRERLRMINDATPVAMIISCFDDGKILYSNQYAEGLLGMKGRDLLDYKISDFYVDPTQQANILEQLASDRALQNLEIELRQSNDELILVLASARKIIFDGKAAVISGFHDITGRRKIEEALRESEERYSDIVEDQTEFISRFEPDGTLIFVNGAYCRLIGKGERELLGKLMHEDVHPDDEHRTVEYLSGFTPKGPRRELENRILRYDGEYRWVHWGHRARFDSTGELSGFQSVGRDITEQKKFESISRRLTAAIDELTESVSLYDKEDRLVFANRKRFEDNSTLSEQYVIGTPYKQIVQSQIDKGIFPEAIGQEEAWLLDRVEKHRNPHGPFEISRPNNVCHLVREYRLPDGGIATLATDITEIKNTGIALAKSEAQLREAQKLETVGTLANGIAHDFNNILSPIMGYVEMALNDLPEGELTHSNLEKVLQATRRARDLVRQMLAFGGRVAHESKPMNVEEVIEDTFGLLRSSLPSTIEIRSLIDSDLPQIMGDLALLKQMLLNLCTNAYQAMPDGGILTISLDEIGREDDVIPAHLTASTYIRIVVSDTGRGMDTATAQRVFEPFFTTREVGEGTGLGLSVVHGIVVGHDGAITIDSCIGERTKFSVFLPTLGVETEEVMTPDLKPLLATGEGHVLYVDDERGVADLGRQMFERLGYDVSVAYDGVEALRVFDNAPELFDIVVTDNTMPKMSGIQLAAELTKRQPDLPVVLITGAGDISDELLNTSEIRAVLAKPVLMEELSAAVKEAMCA